MTEHEELLMLRALAAKQAQELEASKKIIQKRDDFPGCELFGSDTMKD